MSYQIEKGIPCPPRLRCGGSKYPFPVMEVGDSFLVPAADEPTTKRIGMAAYCFARDHATAKNDPVKRLFRCGTYPEGVRCWRIQ